MLLSPSSAVAGVLNNFDAVVAPTVNDDSALGYSVGSRWIDLITDSIWTLVDDTVGAAKWVSQDRIVDGGSFFDTFIDLPLIDGGPF